MLSNLYKEMYIYRERDVGVCVYTIPGEENNKKYSLNLMMQMSSGITQLITDLVKAN